MFNSGIGGFHSDVLAAEPADDESKSRLIEEIKNRAKGSLTTKNYPEAIQLYSKGIELRPTDAILYANRSMCYLQMGNADSALADGEKAIENDASYAKGYFRKGSALVSLKQHAKAGQVFEQGLALAPGDKSFIAQLDKLRSAPQTYTSSPVSSTATAASKRVTPSSTASSTSRKEVSSSSASAPSTSAVVEDDHYDGEASKFRGYKKTADGRVTTFFHNELDEQTKALIGDIAPKKLDPAFTSTDAPSASGEVPGSVWNTAGTWEERVHTPWAVARLKQLIEETQVAIDDACYGGSGVARVKSATVTGDAQVTMARGKVKHIYDFSASVEWEIEMDSLDNDITGSYQVEDISGDREYDFQVSSVVNRQASANAVVNKYIKSGSEANGLQQAIIKALLAFHDEFQLK
ncbi:HOP3 [Symbiodinium microadriaticum]|nr:HOP3 [Symbiodinium microadriaticum]